MTGKIYNFLSLFLTIERLTFYPPKQLMLSHALKCAKNTLAEKLFVLIVSTIIKKRLHLPLLMNQTFYISSIVL